MRCCAFRLAFQGGDSGAATFRRPLLASLWFTLSLFVVLLGTLSSALARLSRSGRLQGNAGPPRFAQTDGDGLLWRACLPSRTCSISSRTNSPAAVDADLPSRKSFFAASTVDLFGMMDLPPVTEGGMPLDSGQDAGAAFNHDLHLSLNSVRVFRATTRRGLSGHRRPVHLGDYGCG